MQCQEDAEGIRGEGGQQTADSGIWSDSCHWVISCSEWSEILNSAEMGTPIWQRSRNDGTHGVVMGDE